MIYNMVELIVIAVSYNMITYEYSMKGTPKKATLPLATGWWAEAWRMIRPGRCQSVALTMLEMKTGW